MVEITQLTSLLLASFIAADGISLDKSPLGSSSLPEIGLKYRCKAITQHSNTHVVTHEVSRKREKTIVVVTATWAWHVKIIFEEFNFRMNSVFRIFQKLNSFEINLLYGSLKHENFLVLVIVLVKKCVTFYSFSQNMNNLKHNSFLVALRNYS